MTPEEMQASSAAKVKQILELMQSLHVRSEARERISQDGFIEKTVFWIDDEQYPSPSAEPTGETAEAEEVAPTGEAATGEGQPDAPTGETGATGE
jgi:hypothetical protein